jgi:hypothetical protein
MIFNATPRVKISPLRLWLEKCFFGRKFLQDKYCKDGHGLVYRAGYTWTNGCFECPECGATDLDELKVDYERYKIYDFI